MKECTCNEKQGRQNNRDDQFNNISFREIREPFPCAIFTYLIVPSSSFRFSLSLSLSLSVCNASVLILATRGDPKDRITYRMCE